MGTSIVQSTDISSYLQDFNRRLQVLEMQPPPAVRHLAWTGQVNTQANQPYSATLVDVLGTRVNFTLSRAATVWSIAQLSWFGAGGTATWAQVQLCIRRSTDPANGGSIQDLDGYYAASGWSVTPALGAGGSTPYVVSKLPAGSYTAVMQYEFTGGATTTFQNLNSATDIMLLGG